ncbi:MAG: PrsW family glutamic-type intramembrane protease [bacterium]|nr:PrsW family glutamic-type intramembrane protease [bacterium]
MTIFFYIIFGLLPSLIWLLFYLQKDSHPESNRMILKVFFYGMIAAVGAVGVEIALSKIFVGTRFSEEMAAIFPIPYFLIYHFLLVSFVEEFSKFSVVRLKVYKSSELDEPLDLMLYMIIAALGFAALENLLYIFPVLIPGQEMSIIQAGTVSFFRFAGATFLHALASGTAGFFLAYSIFKGKHRFLLASAGIALATLLHGLFNISIMGIEDGLVGKNHPLLISSIIFLIILISVLAIAVSAGFRKLKKMAGICKINV